MRRTSIFVVLLSAGLAFTACDATEHRGAGMSEDVAEEASDARDLAAQANAVLQKMQSDPELAQVLASARGVFIVPDYGRGAAVVGAGGGEGVLMMRQNGKFGPPAFYDIGSVSIGAQAGGEGGDIAMVLMTDQGVGSFKGDNEFALNADADLTIGDWSSRAQGNIGKGQDVIFWSDTEGLFAGVSLGASDISWDDEENRAFYGADATPQKVLSGQIQPTPRG